MTAPRTMGTTQGHNSTTGLMRLYQVPIPTDLVEKAHQVSEGQDRTLHVGCVHVLRWGPVM